jgi:type I restriction enzyme M protein
MVAMPGQLFYSTPIPVCLWFIARDKRNHQHRDRRGETLFIDARKLGILIDRVHRDLTESDIAKIAGTYHAWRGDHLKSPRPTGGEGQGEGAYQDVAGFCKSAKLDDIRAHGHVLTPGRYVGAEATEDDGEPFEEKMKRLTVTLEQQFAESAKLELIIKENLGRLEHNKP